MARSSSSTRSIGSTTSDALVSLPGHFSPTRFWDVPGEDDALLDVSGGGDEILVDRDERSGTGSRIGASATSNSLISATDAPAIVEYGSDDTESSSGSNRSESEAGVEIDEPSSEPEAADDALYEVVGSMGSVGSTGGGTSSGYTQPLASNGPNDHVRLQPFFLCSVSKAFKDAAA